MKDSVMKLDNGTIHAIEQLNSSSFGRASARVVLAWTPLSNSAIARVSPSYVVEQVLNNITQLDFSLLQYGEVYPTITTWSRHYLVYPCSNSSKIHIVFFYSHRMWSINKLFASIVPNLISEFGASAQYSPLLHSLSIWAPLEISPQKLAMDLDF